jgi:hypothetical protein
VSEGLIKMLISTATILGEGILGNQKYPRNKTHTDQYAKSVVLIQVILIQNY